MNDVDRYLKSPQEDRREALESLRQLIKSFAPNAEEKISYGVPMIVHHGGLVAFAAQKNHLSFFVMSPPLMETLKKETAKYSTTKSTIHFTPEKPLPATLVKKIVKARMKENEAVAKERETRRRKKK